MRAQKDLRPFVEGPVLPSASPLHRRLSLKLRPHNRPRLRRKLTWRRRNYRRRGKSAGRRGEEEGRPLARSLARSSLPSLPLCSLAPSVLPSIHRSVSLPTVEFPAYLRRLCLLVRSLARPFVLRRQCVNDQRRQRRRQDGETGAGSRSVAAPPPVDRPPTVSQVTGDTSFFFSSPSVCGLDRPPAARQGSEEWLSVINGNEVSSKGKADATTGGGQASERARTTGP